LFQSTVLQQFLSNHYHGFFNNRVCCSVRRQRYSRAGISS
jgi:hypothetical protein